MTLFFLRGGGEKFPIEVEFSSIANRKFKKKKKIRRQNKKSHDFFLEVHFLTDDIIIITAETAEIK